MPEADFLITVASWEERFLLGAERITSDLPIRRVLMCYYREYADWTQENRRKVEELWKNRGVQVETTEISFAEPARTWHTLHTRLFVPEVRQFVPIVDITTMPRDTLWTALCLLRQPNVATSYVYHRPRTYDSEWLSRDPGRPRLVY